jgi:DNA-binding transcriptional ArsR family regulator
MVQQGENLDQVFQALADRTRRAMLQSLLDGERNIGDLAAPHAMSFAAASKHLRVLERAGLVRRRIAGRAHLFKIEPDAIAAAERWIAGQRAEWEKRLDRLAIYLETTAPASGDEK